MYRWTPDGQIVDGGAVALNILGLSKLYSASASQPWPQNIFSSRNAWACIVTAARGAAVSIDVRVANDEVLFVDHRAHSICRSIGNTMAHRQGRKRAHSRIASMGEPKAVHHPGFRGSRLTSVRLGDGSIRVV